MSEIVKKCYNCGAPVTDDHTNRKRPECRACEIPREQAKKERKKKSDQERRAKNRESILKKEAEYREQNREKIKAQAKKHREGISEERKEELKEYARKHREENLERVKKVASEYYQKNKERIAKKHAEWFAAHPEYQKEKNRRDHADPVKREKRRGQARIRCKLNGDVIYKRKWEQKKARFRKDVGFKISNNLRVAFSNAIRLGYKRESVLKLLGCSVPEFKAYIESKFTPGMTWENWGQGADKWNMDHIIPTSSFDMKKEEDQQKCWHYSNFQPLWQKDNIAKSDILPCGNRASELGKVGAQYAKEIL